MMWTYDSNLARRRDLAGAGADAPSEGGKAHRSAESLLRAAEAATELDDWSGGAVFREPLEILVRSLDADAGLSAAGLAGLHANLTARLANRLRIQRDLRNHPEIGDVPIERPVFILGLPRTGTTLLHNLLAQDPTMRAPRLWELTSPSPPPEVDHRDTDPRIAATDAGLEALYQFVPELRAVHAMRANGPEECQWLMQNTLHCKVFEVAADVPMYAAWLARQDLVPAYRDYRRQLQLLTWRWRAERLLLKDPYHIWNLESLLAVFPDARIIQTHRDPVKVLPSFASLCAIVRSLHRDAVDLERLGRYWMSEMCVAVERASSARSSGRGVFYDVRYLRLMQDPLATVREIYQRFEIAWSDTVERNMRGWLAENPPARHGVHRYDLSQFGLTHDDVRTRFSAYQEQFGVAAE
jgi:hypothetical protein